MPCVLPALRPGVRHSQCCARACCSAGSGRRLRLLPLDLARHDHRRRGCAPFLRSTACSRYENGIRSTSSSAPCEARFYVAILTSCSAMVASTLAYALVGDDARHRLRAPLLGVRALRGVQRRCHGAPCGARSHALSLARALARTRSRPHARLRSHSSLPPKRALTTSVRVCARLMAAGVAVCCWRYTRATLVLHVCYTYAFVSRYRQAGRWRPAAGAIATDARATLHATGSASCAAPSCSSRIMCRSVWGSTM